MNDLITKLLRHGLAALAGYLGSMGFAPEGLQTVPLLTALLCFGVSTLWSFGRQSNPFASGGGEVLRTLMAAFAQQLVAALAGWIQQHGGQVDVADPVAVSLFGANFAISNLKQLPRPSSLSQWMIIACLPWCGLSCVTQQSTQQEVARAQAAVEAADFVMQLAEIYWQSVRRDPTQNAQVIAAAELAFKQASRKLSDERARLAALQASFNPAVIPLLPAPIQVHSNTP